MGRADTGRAVCLHYAPVERKTGCELGGGRIAPRDCSGCDAYEPDPCAGQVIGVADLDASERTRCEVWTRVMGYHRPVSQFNAGKRSEHAERVVFREDGPLARYTLWRLEPPESYDGLRWVGVYDSADEARTVAAGGGA